MKTCCGRADRPWLREQPSEGQLLSTEMSLRAQPKGADTKPAVEHQASVSHI